MPLPTLADRASEVIICAVGVFWKWESPPLVLFALEEMKTAPCRTLFSNLSALSHRLSVLWCRSSTVFLLIYCKSLRRKTVHHKMSSLSPPLSHFLICQCWTVSLIWCFYHMLTHSKLQFSTWESLSLSLSPTHLPTHI